jgi:hypothetical protein
MASVFIRKHEYREVNRIYIIKRFGLIRTGDMSWNTPY